MPLAESSWTVDPFSDLVSASELRSWRGQATTKKVMRYLERYRQQVLEALGEGNSLVPEVGASAMKTTEFVAKNQMLKDFLTLEARDIADFYGLDEPSEKEKPKGAAAT